MQTKQEADKPVGVIDAISLGYRFLAQHGSVVLIPFVLDLLFWLGPQISPWQVVRTLLRQAADPELTRVLQEALGLQGLDLANMPASPNVLAVIAYAPGAPPSLVASLGALPAPPGWERLTWAPANPWGFMGLLVGLLLLGTFISGGYLIALARVLWTEQPDMVPERNTWVWVTMNLALLVILGTGLFLGTTVILSVLTVLLALADARIALAVLSLAMLLLSWLFIWAVILFYFTPAAIVLQRVTFVMGLWRSAVVVLRNFWSTLGLVLVTFIISQGFALIWQRLAGNLVGTLISLAGNAFLGSGLMIAAFIFYQDRYHYWYMTARAHATNNEDHNA